MDNENTDNFSKFQIFKTLPSDEQLKRIKHLSEKECEILSKDYDWLARPNQFAPAGNWTYWMVMAGRGFGKTWVGAQWLREQVKTNKYCNIMGATSDDAISIMVEGDSGILSICNKYDRPEFKKSDKKLIWPNGAITLIFSAEEPERLRGKQHMKLWADELGSWRYQDSWDQAIFGLRLGQNPQACITTTPRPTELIKSIVKDKATVITKGSTYDNRSNLAPSFFTKVIEKYEGTRLGRQEINAELLENNENALWNLAMLDELRVKEVDLTDFVRIVVAVDPAVTSGENSDFTGIVVVGKHTNCHYYVLDDLTLLGKPSEWATVAINAYYKYKADRIIAEVNNGGDLVEDVIRNIDLNVSYRKVTATRGKILRAEPIAALYEQKKVHHVGTFSKLEDQMCNFSGSDIKQKSPDRLDALVWGITDLSENTSGWLTVAAEELNRIDNEKKNIVKPTDNWF